MNAIDFTPLYRSTIGYDLLVPLLDSELTTESVSLGFPPYNIEVHDENKKQVIKRIRLLDFSNPTRNSGPLSCYLTTLLTFTGIRTAFAAVHFFSLKYYRGIYYELRKIESLELV